MGQIPKSIALGETHTRQQKDKVETHIHLRVFFYIASVSMPQGSESKAFFSSRHARRRIEVFFFIRPELVVLETFCLFPAGRVHGAVVFNTLCPPHLRQ